jgi:glycosyltransferase involved in cell wall biosynthesis
MRSEPWLARWSRAVVVSNSKAAIDEWLAHGVPQALLRHIPNGLWPPPRPLAAPFAHGGAPRVGMLARLDPVKGHATVLRALARIVGDGLDVRFVSFGRGTPLQLSRLQALAQELGVADRADFRPASESAWDALESIDIFVSASGAEGMSNSLMEAMAAGRVIVATDVGDARAMLTGPDGASGFLTTPDEASITAAIRLALANREAALVRAEAARNAAAAFSPSAMVASYERVYAGLLQRASIGG